MTFRHQCAVTPAPPSLCECVRAAPRGCPDCDSGLAVRPAQSDATSGGLEEREGYMYTTHAQRAPAARESPETLCESVSRAVHICVKRNGAKAVCV